MVMEFIGVAFLLAGLFAVFFRLSKVGFVSASQDLVIRQVRQNQNYALQIAGTLDTKYGEWKMGLNAPIDFIYNRISLNAVLGRFNITHIQKLNNQALLVFASLTSGFDQRDTKGEEAHEKQKHSFSVILTNELLEVYSESCSDLQDQNQKIEFVEELSKIYN